MVVEQVSVEEYIARFVEGGEKPICEYEDGVLIPNPMGTKKHSQVQANIIRLIGERYDATLNPLPELTTRLREGQFFVPVSQSRIWPNRSQDDIRERTMRWYFASRSSPHRTALESSSASARTITSGAYLTDG